MGTDIHGVFQRHDGAAWVDVPTRWEGHRDYQLFAVLAGVRNGWGFAGIQRGDPIAPISEPRGLPADFETTGGADDPHHALTKEAWDSQYIARYYQPGDEGYGLLWMGDHSHSWLTAEEILAWAESAPIVRHFGVITREEFAAWQKGTEPNGYCGAITGRDLSTVEQAEAEAGRPSTHVRVSWHSKLRDELGPFFEEVARLIAEPGRVRFVFGFDS